MKLGKTWVIASFAEDPEETTPEAAPLKAVPEPEVGRERLGVLRLKCPGFSRVLQNRSKKA